MTGIHPTLGVCYYPEHWPESQWADDAERMVSNGLNWVRIGEFAWSRIEPEPGSFDWDWLDRAVTTLGKAGLQIVMGTPTATPPRWMLDRHPDMLAVDAEGRPRGFGSRRHYCFAHLGYREEAVRIARLFGERYGRNRHVHAWQIDNEYGCHDTVVSYSDAARAGFRDWLAQRYQSPQALNAAWGNVFWSMEYREWADVDPPILTVTEPNPSHVLAWRRFQSDQVVAFNRAQANALRPLTEAPLIHNYMGRVLEFDHWDVGADLDIASWDSYPLGFLSDRLEEPPEHKRRFLRQGDPDMQALHHDLYRGVGRGRWWVMEQQPGPVNWAPHNPAPLPGMARLWAHEAVAHGAEAVLYFRWRQAPFAQEQMHAGLLRPDSAAAPALGEAAQVAKDLEALGEIRPATAEVALVFDYDSAWAWAAQPQGADFDYFRLVFEMYRGLRRLGLNVDIIPADTADLSQWKVVLVPGLFTIPPLLMTALTAHPGAVVLGPRTNSRDSEFRIPTPLPPAIPGLEITVDLVESLPPSADEPLKDGGAVGRWMEKLDHKCKVVESTEEGAPILVRSAGLHYLGAWPDSKALHRILSTLCDEQGIETRDLPDGLRLRQTLGHRVWINYAPEAIECEDGLVPAAGVIWQSKHDG